MTLGAGDGPSIVVGDWGVPDAAASFLGKGVPVLIKECLFGEPVLVGSSLRKRFLLMLVALDLLALLSLVAPSLQVRLGVTLCSGVPSLVASADALALVAAFKICTRRCC